MNSSAWSNCSRRAQSVSTDLRNPLLALQSSVPSAQPLPFVASTRYRMVPNSPENGPFDYRILRFQSTLISESQVGIRKARGSPRRRLRRTSLGSTGGSTSPCRLVYLLHVPKADK